MAKKVPLQFFTVLACIFQQFQKYLPMAKADFRAKPSSKKITPKQGKTASEIVKRHRSNKNDKITEDDFKNLRIDLSVPKDRAHQPLKIKKSKERPKDEEKDNTTLTPWDVISE